MGAETVVRVQALGKKYLIGHRAESNDSNFMSALMARDAAAMGRWARDCVIRRSARTRQTTEALWALKGVDFEVSRGDVVGIIGRNGAGKSTLLKILSRIVEPTEGRVEIRGRVASLLEVGTGFHPELTGRENIFLNGAILGMSHAEIQRKFDEIVSFADIEQFLDTPVKRYSSGMYVRLAFAVAAQLEPEILIADEVLAVGDAEFQRKCLGKMHSAAAQGRTVLFVSHNMAAVERLCSRAILLESGRLTAAGPVHSVIAEYLAKSEEEILGCVPDSDENRSAEVKRIFLCDENGAPLKEVTAATTLRVRIQLVVRGAQPDLKIAFSLHDYLETPIFSTCPQDDGLGQPTEAGLHEFIISFPGPLLLPQSYSIAVSVYTTRGHSIHHLRALSFNVQPAHSQVYSAEPNRIGALQVHCQWSHRFNAAAEITQEPGPITQAAAPLAVAG